MTALPSFRLMDGHPILRQALQVLHLSGSIQSGFSCLTYSVSYTHLDVYKRQAYLKECSQKGAERALMISSRTLEKVYKKVGFLPNK